MREDIRWLIANVLMCEVPVDARFETVEEWDSLHHLELMIALEQRFGVTLSTDDMTRLTSIDAIEDYLIAAGI